MRGRVNFQYSRSSLSNLGEAGRAPTGTDAELVAFFAPFSAADADLRPGSVDVGHAQVGGFPQPQTGRVAGQDHRSMFGILDALE